MQAASLLEAEMKLKEEAKQVQEERQRIEKELEAERKVSSEIQHQLAKKIEEDIAAEHTKEIQAKATTTTEDQLQERLDSLQRRHEEEKCERLRILELLQQEEANIVAKQESLSAEREVCALLSLVK